MEPVRRIVQSLVVVLLLVPAAGTPSRASNEEPATDVELAAGKLVHHRLTSDLFHIHGLWMRVVPDTEFHRWLSQGAGHRAAIALSNEPDRFANVPNVRILTGRLIHRTAPATTPLPHILFLEDAQLGTLGAVTFQTSDPAIASAFDTCDESEVSIVIEIRKD